MTERLRRALARREFFGNEKWPRISRISNSFGLPIGKPICIRSLRRFERLAHAADLYSANRKFFSDRTNVRGGTGLQHQLAVSSKRIARTARYLKREGKYAV